MNLHPKGAVTCGGCIHFSVPFAVYMWTDLHFKEQHGGVQLHLIHGGPWIIQAQFYMLKLCFCFNGGKKKKKTSSNKTRWIPTFIHRDIWKDVSDLLWSVLCFSTGTHVVALMYITTLPLCVSYVAAFCVTLVMIVHSKPLWGLSKWNWKSLLLKRKSFLLPYLISDSVIVLKRITFKFWRGF